ncbi:MAG TPA: hypothetical protein VFG59_20480 [Anaeromyxobacter sp.]|nr:hypothetical protein [Anaeromyxobacter sp.]
MLRPAILFLALALSPPSAVAEGFVPVLDLETGAVWASRDDARVPGNGGSTFSMVGGEFQTSTAPFIRVSAGLGYGRHSLAATFAPLRLSAGGRGGDPIFFRNVAFDPTQASARYRLDSYRLTYRYALLRTGVLDLELGVTALWRDTEIRLSQPGLSTSERDTRFLPLASFRLAWRLAGPFALSLDGDALATDRSRAEDVALALEFASGPLTFRAGYRVVEGGVDSSRVYNFAWLNQALVGVRY